MTIIGLNDNGYREYKFSFSATVLNLYLRPESCSPNCLKAKVKKWIRNVCYQLPGVPMEDIAQACLPQVPLFYSFLGEKNAFFSLNMLDDPHNKYKDMSEILSKSPGTNNKNLHITHGSLRWCQLAPAQEFLLLSFQDFGRLSVPPQSHY